jgi:hypothetical protein
MCGKYRGADGCVDTEVQETHPEWLAQHGDEPGCRSEDCVLTVGPAHDHREFVATQTRDLAVPRVE